MSNKYVWISFVVAPLCASEAKEKHRRQLAVYYGARAQKNGLVFAPLSSQLTTCIL
jgi:hypothetical protein